MSERAREAAAKAVDFDRRLLSEPADGDAAVAARWIAVYEELIDAKTRSLAVLRDSAARASNDASRELMQVDRIIIEAEIAHWQQRLEFWRSRLDEPEPAVG